MNQPRPESECVHQLLSRGRGHQVSCCSCGTVHLTLGNTTIRLTRADFATLAASVRAADAVLSGQRDAAAYEGQDATFH